MKEKSAVQWFLEFAESHKMTYIISMVTAVLGVACSLAPYFFIGDMIRLLLEGCKEFAVFVPHLIWMTVFWTARVLLHAVSTSLSHKATFNVLGGIRQRVCDKVYRLPLGYVLNTPSGSIKNVVVERIDSIETALAHIVPEFTGNLLGPVCILVYLFTLDWRMGLASLVTVPIGFLAYMGMMIGYKESFQNTVNKTKILNDTAVEYINGIEVIKAFGKAQSSYEKFVIAAREGASCFVEWMRRCNVFFCLAMVIMPATLAAVLPIGGTLYQNGALSSEIFIMIIVLSLGIVGPIITCASYSDDIGRINVIIGEVSAILTQAEMNRPEKSEVQMNGHGIQVENATFGYGEKEILHGITMEVREGTVNALVGPSGSGKSTIAKLIAGLWDVWDGQIRIGGTDVKKLSLEEQNRRIAYVSQDDYLFNMTVRENIRMGNQNATDEQVEEAARNSGCYEFIMDLEHGFDTVVGDGGGHLSGG